MRCPHSCRVPSRVRCAISAVVHPEIRGQMVIMYAKLKISMRPLIDKDSAPSQFALSLRKLRDEILFKCTVSQQVHQKAIELLLEHIMQGQCWLRMRLALAIDKRLPPSPPHHGAPREVSPHRHFVRETEQELSTSLWEQSVQTDSAPCLESHTQQVTKVPPNEDSRGWSRDPAACSHSVRSGLCAGRHMTSAAVTENEAFAQSESMINLLRDLFPYLLSTTWLSLPLIKTLTPESL